MDIETQWWLPNVSQKGSSMRMKLQQKMTKGTARYRQRSSDLGGGRPGSGLDLDADFLWNSGLVV